MDKHAMDEGEVASLLGLTQTSNASQEDGNQPNEVQGPAPGTPSLQQTSCPGTRYLVQFHKTMFPDSTDNIAAEEMLSNLTQEIKRLQQYESDAEIHLLTLLSGKDEMLLD